MLIGCLPAFAETSTPFKAMTIPGTVGFYDFDIGGEGVAYLKGNAATGNSSYREGENINVWEMAHGMCIGSSAGQWMNYTVNVKKTGYYQPVLYYATPEGGAQLSLSVNGGTASSFSLAPTADYEYPVSLELDKIYLEAGTKVLTFTMVSQAASLFYVDFVQAENDSALAGKNEGSYRTAQLPTRIQAEDFDLGAGGCISLNGKNDGRQYRKNDAIDIYSHNDKDYYISLAAGELTNYTFDVPVAGAYAFAVSGRAKGVVNCYFDDMPAPLVYKTDGADFAEKKVSVIYFDEGEHKVSLSAESAVEIDYIKFTASDEDYILLEDLENLEIDDSQSDKLKTPVYKNLYVSVSGSDDSDGSKESPFATLKRAKEEVAKINSEMTGDIVINIMPGYYQISETEKFGVEHSGKNGFDVIIRGTNILNPPILSGGTEVIGWEQHNDYLWKAPLEADEVRNLYVNDNMSQRARSKYIYQALSSYDEPNTEYDDDGLVTSAINFPEKLSLPADIELVWSMDWSLQRTPVKDIKYQDDDVIFLMDHPYWRWTRTRDYVHTTPGAGAYFYMENAPELLDEPGEFYYNKEEKMIYYYPFAKENMKEAKTYVGTCEQMFSVLGNGLDEHITNITFDNLDIRYGAWNDASVTGLVGAQADKMIDCEYSQTGRGGKIPPSQMTILNADNITIKNCRFTCLGSGAISMYDDVSDCVIDGNSIDEISGTGIIVGSWDHNIEREGMKQCHDIDITNNLLYRNSSEFKGGTAISVYYEKNINILHNHILEAPYTGVTLGWGWGEAADFGNIRLSYNHIEDTVIPPMFDGAFIYTLGPLQNSEISYNYLTDTASDYSGGIYPDSGSAYLKIHHNVIEKTPYWFFGGVYNTHDLHTYDNYSDTSVYTNHSDLNTIELPEIVEDGNWNDEAKAIIEGAGLEPRYSRMLKNIDYPEWRTDFVRTAPQKVFEVGTSNWIEAEDYNEGGEGVAYHKITPANNTNYRKGEVHIYDSSGSYNGGHKSYVIGTTFDGEWLCYDVEIPESGNYELITRGANSHYLDGGIDAFLNVYVDGELVVSRGELIRTPTWGHNMESFLGVLSLSEGVHQFKMEFADNGYSFDAFRLSKVEEDSVRSGYNDASFDEGIRVYEEDLLGFLDITGHWAEDDIWDMFEKGMVKGVSQTEFAPDLMLTGEQGLILAMRSSKLSFKEDDMLSYGGKYGLLDGIDKNAVISRGEYVDILMKAYMEKNGTITLTLSPEMMTTKTEKDLRLAAAIEMGIIHGDENGDLRLSSGLTRAEAVTMMKRILK